MHAVEGHALLVRETCGLVRQHPQVQLPVYLAIYKIDKAIVTLTACSFDPSIDFISSAIEYFFTPGHFETFLIVTCTSPKTKEIMVRTYKNKPRSHEGPAIHTEEQFLYDVGRGDFPEGSEFVLFSNHSPCPKRDDKRTCCCELLLKTTVFKEKKTKIPQIYFLYLYKNVLSHPEVVKKLKDLCRKGFVIKFLPIEKLNEFISLFPEKKSLRTKATKWFTIKRKKFF